MSRSPLSFKVAAIGAAAAACAAFSVGAVPSAGAAGPSIQPHRITVNPDNVKISADTDATKYSCQNRPIDGSQGLKCYSPSQIQAAYGIKPLLDAGDNGAGRTIVIVDAFQNPYIQSDLDSFDQLWGLPKADFHNFVMPGTPAFDVTNANQVGWGGETTLDVLWAHAVAPGAKIELVSAASNEDSDILAATQYAVDHDLGDVLSQSFGENENCVDPQILSAEHQMYVKARSQGWTVFASSGDSGASQFTCDGNSAVKVASSPASDPLVTGVGGTTLNADANGTYTGETAWTDPSVGCNAPAVATVDVNCSGGGFSDLYAKPAFQASAVKGKVGRGVPDIAYNAGVNGGVLTVCSVCNKGVPAVFLFGGTSAGSPQWAGLAAIGDQLAGRRLGDINPALYAVANSKPIYASSLHDVVSGNNDVSEIGGTGYNAGRGWDPVTGLGTPNAAKLLPQLINRIVG